MRLRKVLWLCLFAVLFAWSGGEAQAQPSTPSFRYVSVAPSGACNVGTQNRYDWITNVEYGCSGAGPGGTWSVVGGGSAGTCATLGGDVTGTCAANTVVKIQNVPVSGVQGTATNPKVMAAGAILPGIGLVFCQDSTGSVTTGNCAAGTSNQNTRSLGYHFDGGGSALSGTTTYCAQAQSAGTIFAWYVSADAAGNATFGIRSVAFGSYTGVAGYSGYTDVTGGGTAPALSSAVSATDVNLNSWVTSVAARSLYCFQLSSPGTIKWVDVVLYYTAN